MDEESNNAEYRPKFLSSLIYSEDINEAREEALNMEDIENELLFSTSANEASTLFKEMSEQQAVISNLKLAEQEIKFFSPTELEEMDDESVNSGVSSSDEVANDSSDDSTIDKRGGWKKRETEEDSITSSTKTDNEMILRTNLERIIAQDIKQELGNIELVSKMDKVLEDHKREIDDKLLLIKDNNERRRYTNSVKLLNPHGLDRYRQTFSAKVEDVLRQENLITDKVEGAMKAYNMMLEAKTKIRRFKFNIERKLALDILQDEKSPQIYEVLSKVRECVSLMAIVLDTMMRSGLKIRDITNENSSDEVAMLKVGITFQHGIELKIDDESYANASNITSAQYNTITRSDQLDPELKKLITEYKVVILDVPNMTQAMMMTSDQINSFALHLNDHGMTTVAIVDNVSISIDNATINVIENQYGHDDITTLLYAIAYDSVIVTNDTHKEFRKNIMVCVTHNNIITRLNEECNVNDCNKCILRRVSPRTPKYISIQKYVSTAQTDTVTFHLPLVRTKTMRKKGTTTIKFKTMSNQVIKRWNIRTNGRSPIMVTTVKNAYTVSSYNVLTFNFNSTTELIINNNKVRSLAYLLNTLSTEQITIIKRKIKCKLGFLNDKLVLQDNANNTMVMNDNIVVDNIRSNIEQRVISKIFGDYNITYKTSGKTRTLYDLPKYVKYSNEISILVTKTSIKRAIGVVMHASDFYLVMIDIDVINAIESKAMQLMDRTDSNEIRQVLPVTDRGMAQHILYKKPNWTDDVIGDIVEMTIGNEQWKQLDLKGFKSGNVYWDLRYNKDVSDLGTISSVEDIKNISSDIDHTIIVDTKKNKPQIYNSGRSGSIYDHLESIKTMRKFVAVYTESKSTPDISIIKLGRYDAQQLYNAIHKPIRDKVHDIVEDIVRTYKTMVTDSCLVCLPPMIWAFVTEGVFMKEGMAVKLIEFRYMYKNINIICYVSVRQNDTIVAFKLKANYKVLYPAIAMRYSNNYEPITFDFTYMDYILENGMGMMRDDPQIYTNLDNYKSYYNVFALPLIYAGFAPSSYLTKYRPVIVDNIVVDYMENHTAPMASFLDEVVMEPALWLSTTDVGFIYPMKRMLKYGTDLIDVNGEIHSIIDELYLEPVEQELKYPMFLMVFRLMHPWAIIIQHLSECYQLPVDEYMSPNEVATQMIMCWMPPCECAVGEQTQTDIMGSITNYPQTTDKTITTHDAKMLVTQSNDATRVRKMYKFQHNEMINSIPLIGNVVVVDIVKEREQWKKNRQSFSKNIMSQQSSMTVVNHRCVIKRDNDRIADYVGKMVTELVNNGNGIIVILGFDELGPLIKTQKEKIMIITDRDVRLYIPDMLLYTCFSAYLKVKKESKTLQTKYSKITQEVNTQSKSEVIDATYKDLLRSSTGVNIDVLVSNNKYKTIAALVIVVIAIILIVMPIALLWPNVLILSISNTILYKMVAYTVTCINIAAIAYAVTKIIDYVVGRVV